MNKNRTTQKRERLVSVFRSAAFAVAVFSLLLFGAEHAAATVLYATESSNSDIYRVDTITNAPPTLYFHAPASPDSLMFDTTGNVIYSVVGSFVVPTGEVHSYNPNTAIDTVLAANLFGAADVVLEPGGQTMLVSEFYGGRIDRIDLTNSQKTILVSNLTPSGPEGLAYVGTRLFANIGARAGTAKRVAEINPVTGGIIAQSANPLPQLDGLTYDTSTQKLYAASLFGNTVFQVAPNNLNAVVNLGATYGWSIPGADGIASDGSGHIFVASAQGAGGNGHVYDIVLATGTLTPKQIISPRFDDLAPASGLGAPPGEPFPGQQCCGEKPHFEDPAYSTVFTGQLAVATCYSDLGTNPVLAIEDLKNQATAPLNTNYLTASYHGPGSSWTRDNLGDIFGVTLDDTGNIYVTATTAYRNDVYVTGRSAMDIYVIAGGTGAITPFATLPQSPATFPGAGLGNIAYDCAHKNLYVSNIDDGLIYRLDLSGTTLSTWDHGLGLPTANPPSAAIPDDPRVAFTPLGRRVWGLQPHEGRLYYGVWWQDERANPAHPNEVWSVALSSSGNFVPGTDRLEITLPPIFNYVNYSNPVSDISFGPAGTMLVAERSMADDTTPDAHKSRALEYMLSGTSWIPTGHVFDIGDPSLLVTTSAAGGVDYDFGAGGRVWVTGDALHFGPPTYLDYIYGLQGLPSIGGSILNSILIDLDGITNNFGEDKTQIGDVEVPCPDCEIDGTVVTPSQPGGPYTYQFTVTNHSTQAASNIVILPVSGVTSITPQTIHLSPALQPGQTSPTFTLTLNGVQPGVQACFNIALVSSDGTTCCSRQVCVPIPDCFEVLSQVVKCLPNGQVQLTVTIKNLEAYTLYYAAVLPSNPSKTATPNFFTLSPTIPPFGTTTISTVISPVAFGETVFYTLTIHSANLEICCSRDLSFTAKCKRIIIDASSQLTHGRAGSFDIDMPLTGTSGVEDRDGAGKYLAVFTYDDTVTSGEATIVSGTATAGQPIFSGNQFQVPLTEVADQQNVTIELSNVNGEDGADDVTFSFLIGDVNGDRTVNNTDASEVKANNGQPVTGSNFRDDINLTGRVDKADSTAVTTRKGHRLP